LKHYTDGAPTIQNKLYAIEVHVCSRIGFRCFVSIVRSGEFGGHADVMHLAKLGVTIIESNVLKLAPSTQVADHICPNNN